MIGVTQVSCQASRRHAQRGQSERTFAGTYRVAPGPAGRVYGQALTGCQDLTADTEILYIIRERSLSVVLG